VGDGLRIGFPSKLQQLLLTPALAVDQTIARSNSPLWNN
jgi:hypothetical protein